MILDINLLSISLSHVLARLWISFCRVDPVTEPNRSCIWTLTGHLTDHIQKPLGNTCTKEQEWLERPELKSLDLVEPNVMFLTVE